MHLTARDRTLISGTVTTVREPDRPDVPAETSAPRRPAIQWGAALAGAVRKLDPRGLLRQPVVWDSFADNALLQLGYVVIFGALAYGRFTTKDVLS